MAATRYTPALLRKWRLRAGLTQEDAAGRARRTAPMLSRYESGDARPTPDILAALAAAYGCSVSDFFMEIPDRQVVGR